MSSPRPTPRSAPDSPFDPALAESGRLPTLVVLVGIFMLATVPFLTRLFRGDVGGSPEVLARNILYAVATALLLGQVWRGSVWAWRITISLCMLAGLLVFVVGMLAGAAAWQGWLVSGAGIAFLLLGTALVATPAIRSFLDARWLKRSGRGRA